MPSTPQPDAIRNGDAIPSTGTVTIIAGSRAATDSAADAVADLIDRAVDPVVNSRTLTPTGFDRLLTTLLPLVDEPADLPADPLERLIALAIATAPISPAAVVSGTAPGPDQAGEAWAHTLADIPIAQFPAPWDDTDHPDAVVREGQYGPYDARAGHRRNEWMAEYTATHGTPGTLLAILAPDNTGSPSSGTSDMISLARETLGDDHVYVVPVDSLADDPPAEFTDVLHPLYQ